MNTSLNRILHKDFNKNIATIGFFENYPVKEFYTESNSALVLGESDNLWMHLVSNSEEELKILLEKHKSRTKYYFSVEEWMISIILKYGTADWIMTTNRYILDSVINIPSPKNVTYPINISFANVIYQNSEYRDFISVDYIMDRLKKDVSAGIIVDDKLVAWGFTHDDGAIGFLHVLEEFRGKGFGIDVLLSLVANKRTKDQAVFGNIVSDNLASTSLVTKIGFKFDRKTSWLKLR